MKKYIFIFIAILCFGSCESFLEEDFRSGENSESIVASEETFETLINSCYVSLRAWYGKENAWDLTEVGTDLFTWGLDNRSIGFCTYETFTTDEEQDRVGAIWREFYKALNNCNIVLTRIDEVPFSSEEMREQRRAEVKYLRAHYLWLISEIWGGVHFSTEPSEGATRTANRTPVETFRAQILQDLEEALAVLPDEATGADYGRATKAATEAMLARVNLYMGNYSEASTYAQNVINNYNYQLIDDWEAIWDIDNIKNQEIIWAVNYSDDPTFTNAQFTDVDGNLFNTAGLIQREGGNQGHLMWEIRYENLSWGMVRDLENGRGFQRWAPTKYHIDLFDETIDERFYGSFKTTWYANSEDVLPKWFPFLFIDGEQIPVPMELWAEPMFAVGDTAIVFYKNPVPADQKAKRLQNEIFHLNPDKGYLMIDINDMYLEDGSLNDAVINRQFYFPITKKYQDPTRPQLATAFSKRDAYVFRISEMYLIAAEAELMQGKADVALGFINELREARSVEGKEADMMVTEDVLDIDFILDERARELATEFQRFFDLKRTGKLVERVQTYNHDAAPFIQQYHGLRFIPQSQIDAMTDGESYQNPGY
ncbi:MAG: RagB/SusD family nutrient uptake outer membrane protein [Bacteroidetes bacterium]|nr:MAG: RagB/SusD family nutrient uptake outer membrane protein [Bacteroidota bacterium]